MFIIKLLSQHVSGIIMPIITRTKTVYYCRTVTFIQFTQLTIQLHTTTASTTSAEHHMQYGLVLLMIGILMPETC